MMRGSVTRLCKSTAGVVVCVLALACGGEPNEPSDDPGCIPNEVTECTCANGAPGTRSCALDGMSVGSCTCGESPAAGAGPGGSAVGTAGADPGGTALGTAGAGSAGTAPPSPGAGGGAGPGLFGGGSGAPGFFGGGRSSGASGNASPGFFGGGNTGGGNDGGGSGGPGLCQIIPQLCGGGQDETDAGMD